jgi:hypothetical protein
MAKHVAWDYENGGHPTNWHYHIYPHSDQGEAMMDDENLCLTMPETPENSADVQAIVDALDRLAGRA